MPSSRVTGLLIRAVAGLLPTHPYLNASQRGEEILLHDGVDIGMTVARAEGLVVPVGEAAGGLGLEKIPFQSIDLAWRGRDAKLTPHELSGQLLAGPDGGESQRGPVREHDGARHGVWRPADVAGGVRAPCGGTTGTRELAPSIKKHCEERKRSSPKWNTESCGICHPLARGADAGGHRGGDHLPLCLFQVAVSRRGPERTPSLARATSSCTSRID